MPISCCGGPAFPTGISNSGATSATGADAARSRFNLTNNPAWDIYPRWTPDGKHIIFFSDRDSKFKLAQIWDQLMEAPTKGLWGLYRQQGDDFRTRDVEEGRRAFEERRAPRFTGS